MIEFNETSYAIEDGDGNIVAEFLIQKSANAVLKCMGDPDARVLPINYSIRIYQTKTEYDRAHQETILQSAIDKLSAEEFDVIKESILLNYRA